MKTRGIRTLEETKCDGVSSMNAFTDQCTKTRGKGRTVKVLTCHFERRNDEAAVYIEELNDEHIEELNDNAADYIDNRTSIYYFRFRRMSYGTAYVN